MSNFQKNLLSLMFGCILAFGLLEVLFRLPVWVDNPIFPFLKLNGYSFQDRDDVVRYAANASGGHLRWDGEEHLIHVNRQGFRGDLIPENKPVSILLGDSVIFNGGVVQEQALDTLLTQAKGHRVLNFGVSGTSLYHYQQRFEHDILGMEQVRRVYVCFYLNDLIRDPIPPFLRSNSQRDAHPSYGFHSYAIAHFGMLVKCAVVVYTTGADSFEWVKKFHQGWHRENIQQWKEVRELAQDEWGSAWEAERWVEFDERIELMSQMAQRQNIELILVLFPVELQVSPEFLTDEMTFPQRTASEIASKWGVPVIDLLPAFRGHQGASLFFDHCHLTPTGNQVAASAIEAKLQP
ncbi:MAG: hypothetical protein AAF571_02010 [Verrucomicrobiota bacterium]